MIDGVRIKVCGLTTLVDAEFADRAGADYLGFILYPKSPRCISLRQFRDMSPRLPEGRKRVAVTVEPSDEELVEINESGFDRVQIHFGIEHGQRRLEAWSRLVTPERLWIAPKLPPEMDVPDYALAAANTVLMDTFHKGGFGGSGQTGDWDKFRRHQETHPEKTWVLAGGLSSANVRDALNQSGANFLDANSGVETAPGIKDHAKIKAFVLAIHRAREA